MARRIPVYQRIAAHCLAKGITAEELARRTGMPPRRVQRLLTKKTRVLAEDVPAIARALDTTISSLYGEDESEAATS